MQTKWLKSQSPSQESAMDCMFGDQLVGTHARSHELWALSQMTSQSMLGPYWT